MMVCNILFIGGAGFIGSSVIKKMQKSQFDGHIMVLEPDSADTSRLKGCYVDLIRGTISDIDLIEKLIHENNIKKIVHLVSTLVPGCGYDEYKKEFENVIFPTVQLMQLCGRLNVKFVYFSSGGTVYGERKSLEPFRETDPKEPISYYGLSKQMIENCILFEHRMSNLQYVILRPSNPYGPGQNIHGRQGLIATAIGKILSGKPITIWGDGSSVRDYIYIDDLAKVVTLLLKDDICNTIVNIGSSKGYSVSEVIETLMEIVEEKVTIEFTQSRKSDVSNMILDTSLLKTLMNIELTPLKHGIKMFYQFEKGRISYE